MEVEVAEAKLLAALELVQKRIPGLGQGIGVRMTQIDEVAVVGQDLLGAKARLVAGLFEGANAGLGERRRLPLALVLGEQGEGIGPDGLRAGDGVFHPAGGTDVGSDKFHNISSAL
ncbi:hypothetical protein D3C76_1295080 [compost metagenome]